MGKSFRLCLILSLPLFSAYSLSAQTVSERQADFIWRWQAPDVLFAPVLPPLVQIAGAPPAFYEYYWEFGDGTFSFEENPGHVYLDSIEHEVYFLATGKYDNGKAPKSRKKKTEAPKEPPKVLAASEKMPAVLRDPSETIGLRAVRNPRAGEELVCILAYTNHTPAAQSGKLHLFFNQRTYKNDHFQFLEARTHFGESEETEALTWNGPPFIYEGWTGAANAMDWYATSLPSLDPEQAVEGLKSTYKTGRTWRFDGLQPDELRHLFVSLNATEEMLADTNAIITVSALLVSDDQRIVERFDLEMEIVASHDPNYIAVSKRRASFRGIHGQDLTYKVHFQNNGEGPASKVEITCDVPPGLNAAQLRVLDAYPKCPLCPEEEVLWSCLDTAFQEGKVIFTFRNIYLPGTRQEGVGDRDSTKGFVKYRLLPDKSIRKLSLDSRASIVFDKNPPIRTNKATTGFKRGLSPGLMAGWNFFPADPALDHFTAGVSLAPFKPYRSFLQWELWTGLPFEPVRTESIDRDTVRKVQDIPGLPFPVTIDSVTTTSQKTEQKPLYLSIVPLQLRKNIADWFGVGAGVLLNLEFQKTEFTENNTRERFVYRTSADGTLEELVDFYAIETSQNTGDSRAVKVNAAFFADIHLGMVRHGPALGLRGLARVGEKPAWYFSAFASWKF
jgi:hypothetical protein